MTNNFIITSINELRNISNRCNEIKGKKITIEGLSINEEMSQYYEKIIYNGKPKKININNCLITDENCSILIKNYEYGTELSIINCKLTPFQGRMILKNLDPYNRISIDFSYNQLGGEGKDNFLKSIISDMNNSLEPFSTLNLSFNGFTETDISNFNKSIQFCSFHSKVIFK